MNLLCPNCQKMLQVPEQYAGQQMKCPLCAGAFTVPALPQMPAAASMPVATREPTPAPPPPLPPEPAAPPRKEKAAAPADTPRRAAADFTAAAPPEGYTKTRSFSLNPNLVPLVAPLALGTLLLLMFFSWVAIAPDGETAVSENAFQIAGGSFDPDTRWLRAYQTLHSGFQKEQLAPGWGVLMIFFLLLFFFAALPLSILCVLVARKSIALPPALSPLIPWRSALLALVLLGAFFLLLLQQVFGTSLESKAREVAESYVAAERARPDLTPDEKKINDYRAAMHFAEFGLYHTTWFKLGLLLLLLAIVGAVLDYWLEKRGSQPAPRIDILS